VKWLWFLLAWISFILGVLGAFLPILPSTPFFILTAFLFSKSSPKFHAWILNLPLIGDAIEDWQVNRIIRPKAKILCSLMIFISLTLIWFRAPVIVPVKFIITVVLVSVGSFVVTRKGQLG
jgi:uncharacterized membrane protein YbaN (DUF454 family)